MMSTEEDMEYQSFSSPSANAPIASTRRRSVVRKRGHSLNSSHVRRLDRTLNRGTSTPKSTRRSGRSSNQSSTINQSSIPTNEKNENVAISLLSPIPSSNPSHRSQSPAPPLPFDCPSDDEQHQKYNTAITTKSGKMKKDVVLSHFTLRPDGRYDCNTCHQPYMAYNGSATNLRRHLFIKHDITAAVYDSQLSQIKQKPTVSNDMSTALPKNRKKQLDQAVVDCIIDDPLPFTTFMKPGMINLLKTFDPRYEPPSRFTIASQVDDAYHKYVDEVKTVLKRPPAIAFTADIWKSGTRKYYISLTAHLFNKDFEVLPLVLSLRQLTERHLAVNIQSFIMFELDEKFGITHKQRVGITTDCGPEMVAATAHGLFGTRYACIAHVWNNVVKNGLCLWSSPDPKKFPVNESDANINESIQSVGGDEDDLQDDEDQQTNQLNNDETPESNDMTSSPSDPLQPTTLDVVILNKKPTRSIQDEYLSEDDEPVMIQPETRLISLVGLLERVFNLVCRCRQLVQDIRNIGVVQTFVLTEVGKRGRGVTLDMEIRWNTTFQMLDRLLEHQTLIDTVVRRKFDGLSIVQTNRLKLAALTPDDWDVLRALHQVLLGFDVATTIVSASQYPTLSDSFWATTKLRQILVFKIDDSRYVEFLKKSALNYLDIYIQKHLSNEQQEGMLIAAFLDPETHNDLSKNDFTIAMGVVKQKIKQIPTFASTTTTITTTATATSSSSPSPTVLSKKDSAKQLMNQLAGIDPHRSSTRPMSADVEVSLFTNAVKTKENFKQFWATHCHSFPRLVALVHRYCLVPATSVASESAFSIAGFIARKQRSSLSSCTLRHLLVLKYRKNLIKFQSEDESLLIQDHRFQSLSLDGAGSSSV